MVGVTHWNRDALPDLADALRTGRFEQVQLPYNPAERDQRALAHRRRAGLAVIVMRPFADGGLLASPPPQEALEPLRPFGIETWPQALLKWVLSDERVDVAIPATSRPERTRENAAAGSRPGWGRRARLRRSTRTRLGFRLVRIVVREDRRRSRRPDARGRARAGAPRPRRPGRGGAGSAARSRTTPTRPSAPGSPPSTTPGRRPSSCSR